MKTPTTAIVLSLVIFLSAGCGGPTAEPPCGGDPPVQPAQIVRMEYGTSFGFCAGYCWSRITISGGSTSFTKGGWNNSVPELTCDGGIPCHQWSSLTGDVNLSEFHALNETIGCPDCADGGAEWIELETQTSAHRVTYEYGNPPAGLEALAGQLGQLKSSFADCE